jgi:hypothetical protein
MASPRDRYPGLDLLPQHAALLAASAIADGVAVARGYRSVTVRAELGRLGFPPAQRRVPALLLPVWSAFGEVALYQLRPDDPRVEAGRARKYETPLGARMALDVPPPTRRWLGDPARPLVVTEGLRKADAAVSVGLCCVALLGVWNWRGANADGGLTALADWEHVHLKGRTVYLVFDSDAMTKPVVHAALARLGAFLTGRGTSVRYVYLPAGDGGTKTGLDDFLVAGHGVDDLFALASPTLRRPVGAADGDTEPLQYSATERGLVWHRPTAEGAVRVPLTNFVARIVAVVLEDDGQSTRRVFAVEATLRGRSKTQDIAASAFAAMAWQVELLGAGAVVEPGQGTKERARVAIQVLSGELPEQTVYTHAGWRVVDGAWCYLHAGGAVGAAGTVATVSVRLPGALARLRLPNPPAGDDLVAAVRASLALLDLLPFSVAAPLLAATFLAVLREPLGEEPPDFTLWLHGPSGAFKSELQALGMAHYGGFTRHALPAKFRDTANYVEGLCFAAKDALLGVDDYHPAADPREARAMEQVANRLLRGLGNGAGRGRMRADASLRPDLPPRCVPVASGERLPEGHSNAARAFPVAVAPGAVDPAKLAVAQRQRDRYPAALAGYLRWLAGRFDALRAALPARFRELRARAQRDGGHRREPGQVAHLHLGLETWLGFAAEAGAVGARERDGLLARAWDALLAHAAEHGADLDEQAPVRRFLALLADGFAGKRAYLEAPDGGAPEDAGAWGWEIATRPDRDGVDRDEECQLPGGMLLGVLQADWLLLFPEATMQFVTEAARRQGRVFPVETTTLLRRLDEEGLIATEPKSGRRTPNAWIGGRSRRVIKLRRAAFEPPAAQWDGAPDAGRAGGDVGGEAAAPSQSGLPRIPAIPCAEETERTAPEVEDAEVVEWSTTL